MIKIYLQNKITKRIQAKPECFFYEQEYKLALLGCGYLNEIVANVLKDNYLPEYELIGVLGRNIF